MDIEKVSFKKYVWRQNSCVRIDADKLNRIETGVDESVKAINEIIEHGGGGTSTTYIHDQSVISDIWIINHNLNKYPSVSVVDSNGYTIFGQVLYESKNKIKIFFSENIVGKAYLN